MSPEPFKVNGADVDLSARVVVSNTVVASPVDATETIICTVTIGGDMQLASGVRLDGFAAYTVGTNGVSGRLRIRRTNVGGATKADTDVITQSAAAKVVLPLLSLDAGAPAGTVYVLTLTVGSATAVSTVSNVALAAVAI